MLKRLLTLRNLIWCRSKTKQKAAEINENKNINNVKLLVFGRENGLLESIKREPFVEYEEVKGHGRRWRTQEVFEGEC